MVFGIAGCYNNQSDVVSKNIGEEADRFTIPRRIIFYNGITNEYILTIEGFCSLGNDRSSIEIAIICKIGTGDTYKKHFLGRSDNVTYFVEQLEAANINPDHYKVIFRPSTIIPDIDIGDQ